MTTEYNDDYTDDQRDLYVYSHGKKVATVTVINGTVWYTDELGRKEYILLEIAQSGAILTDQPVLA